MKYFRYIVAGTLLPLSSCASFDGMQEPLMGFDGAAKVVNSRYSLTTVLDEMEKRQEPVTRRIYRNRVAAIWMMGIDGRYSAFRRDLSRHMKGSRIGLDLVTLGLTSTASVVTDAADELAAAATGVGGAKASLDRELYFEKALPALVAYMDAERLQIRADITRGLAEPESTYSIEKLLADLSRYEAAGSLDKAIAESSRDAALQVAEAEGNYRLAATTCVVPENIVLLRQGISTWIAPDGVPNSERLAAAAKLAGDTAAEPSTDQSAMLDQREAVGEYLIRLCNEAEVNDYKLAIESAISQQGADQ